MRSTRGYWRAFLLAFGAVAAGLTVASAGAQGIFYGVSVAKGCDSPTYVGKPYQCFFIFGNNNPTTTSGDTVTLSAISDQIANVGGPLSSGNILSQLQLVANPTPPAAGAPTCTGPTLSGNGSLASPWKGATLCTLPYGSSIISLHFSYYTPTIADFNQNPLTHKLTDQATFGWTDKCDKTPTPDTCDPVSLNNSQAPASSTLKLYTPTITTVLSAAAIGAGGTVHDTSAITFDSTPPTVTGTVTYKLYTDNTCTTLSTTPSLNQTVNYTGGSVPNSQDVTFPSAGNFWFQATFSGDPADGVVGPVSSPCTSEPLNVVDAKISITPNGTNPVGSPHTFTVQVQTNPGSGFANASGAVVNVSIAAGGVGTLTPTSCTTDGTGTCTVVDKSSSAGTDVVSATTTVNVGGVSLTRTTDSTHGSSGPATKQWVAAKITISPSATNQVGQPHTFTVTLSKNSGAGFAPAPNEHVTVTLTDTGGAAHTAPTGSCTTGGANTDANGQCTITFTSPTPGVVTGHASATLNVGGVSTTVQTDGVAPNSGDAVKTFVDANIKISPATATNAVGANHTLTITVAGLGGTIDAGTYTATASLLAGSVGSFVGSPTCTYTAAAASCNVVITSTVTGTSVVHAVSTVSVNGQSITRATNTAVNTAAGGSGDASKTWVDANIKISPATATNAVGTNHTLTITVAPVLGTIDAGTYTATASLLAGSVGSLVGSPTCTYTAAAPSCNVVITSTVSGTSVVHALTIVKVSGQSITRETNTAVNTAAGGSGDASKTWVNANISITPATATNAVGTNHTLTITVAPVLGTIDAGTYTATASLLAGSVGSFVGSPTCTYTAAAPTCNVVITSAVSGTSVVHALTIVKVSGQSITRETNTAVNTAAGGSGDASKTWVNANISITPATATNAVGTNHTLTITVAGVGGTIDAGTYTATASLLAGSVGSFVGSPTCTYTAAAPTCNVVITSAVTGTSVVHALTIVKVSGQSITRETNTAVNTAAGGSGDASKTWVNANIKISPATATNAVGANHTLTITVAGLGGTIDAGTYTATASLLAGSVGSFVGPSTCTYTETTKSCTVVITSTVTGTSVVHALTAVKVGGQSITRETNTAVNTAAGGSGDASKTWVDANISITPSTAINAVGTNHTLTITVAPVLGTIDAGSYNATASIVSGPGSFVGSPTCAYTNVAPSCTVVITSPTAGVTVVHAESTVKVSGQSIIRATNTAANTAAGGTGDASKTWVDASVSITPATDTNAVNTNHTLTITVVAGSATIDAGTYTATASIVTNTAGSSFVGGNTCVYSGGASTATCTVVISSATTGTTTVGVTTTFKVNGQSITRTTGTAQNTAAGGSGNASKTWVNANIKITPATASNAVGTNHTLTITVAGLNGTIDGGTYTATASIASGIGSFVGSPTCTYTAAAPSCNVVITSAVTGTSVVHALTIVKVSGQSITRETNTAVNTAAGGSGDASKTWVNGYIKITPATATNAVGTNHTLTITVAGVNGTIDAGTYTATASLLAGGVGAFVGSPTCTYTEATKSCTVVITSATTGTTVVHAASTFKVSGQSITRETNTAVNTAAGGSGDASKTWVDANIKITPATATNPVRTNHTLTITVASVLGTINAGTYTATASIASGPGSVVGSSTCTYTDVTKTCNVVITSSTAGTTVVHAVTTVTVSGQSITRATNTAVNTAAGGSGDASKTWVDANIQITPATAANPLGTMHVLTGHVNVNPGTGSVNAPDGTTITFSIVSGPGSFVGGVNTCTTTAGSCTVKITSTTVGTTVVKAATDVTVGGISLHRESGDGLAGDSANASKTWESAKISITPDATNEVGQPHTFTVTLQKDIGAGFVPAAGEHVTVTLTDSNGAAHTAPTGSCTTAGANTNASGQCTITFTSPTAGKVTGHASSTLNVGGFPITVATDGVAPNSGDAVKTFVDANIQLTPLTATNNVGVPHVFTAHVNVNAGSGSFTNAPAGTTITFSIVSGPGTLSASSCATVTTTGSCSVTLTNATTPGTTVVRATTTLSVGGRSLTRSTADGKPGDSANATKTWIKCVPGTFTLTGNTSSTGTPGNIRSFTSSNNVQLKASAFNRATNGAWTTAYLGAYSPGLGVTNRTENGSDPTHKVDNVGSVDYVLFEFASPVVIDQAFLDSVTTDSDISVWIGTKTDAFNNHQTLSDSFLSSLGFTEENLTSSSASRTADINAGGVEGNILVIAALASDTSPEDQFKIHTISTTCPNACVPGTATLTGNTSTTGTPGNIRPFTASNNVQLKASAFNRANNNGAWTTAYLGAYSPGLGVTNRTEDGSDPTHKVDNVGGSVDYVLFEFASPVVIDQAFLDSVTTDSDISVWIGTKTDPFNNHQTLSDAFLSSLGFTEENLTSSSASRTADINAGGVAGNILVIAAQASDTSGKDQFKINTLYLQCK